jgi:regulator of CtrA degradation
MADRSVEGANAVSFAERFAGSQAFSALFREGMTLVEETASYLDGAGRREAKGLTRNEALSYATESMRLTTRLMQLASWLLLHRAVSEGEMSIAQARREKAKVAIRTDRDDAATINGLPVQLQSLIRRSMQIQERVQRLDHTIHAPVESREPVNPVARQLGALNAAFGQKSA